MQCKDWEERVALHVGGDLASDDASAVERHLAGCAGCQVLWSGMRESLELLHGAHVEALPSAAYTAVRGRVMAELAAGQRVWWRWVAGLAAVAAVMLGALAVWPERAIKPLPRVVLAVPPVFQTAQAKSGTDPQTGPPAPPRQWGKRAAPAPRQPLLVRLVTDDPNIVIYWIAD
jgi:anti-sigma factor RsiW